MRNSYFNANKMHSNASVDLESTWPMQSWDLSNWYSQEKSKEVRRGKVRQLFEERRGAGRDKSYPLEPIRQRGISLDRYQNSNEDKHSQYNYHTTNSNNNTRLTRNRNSSANSNYPTQSVTLLNSDNYKPVSQYLLSDMTSKKVPFDSQGKQLSHALYNLNLGTQNKDGTTAGKGNTFSSASTSPNSKPTLSRIAVRNSPVKTLNTTKPQTESRLIRSPQAAKVGSSSTSRPPSSARSSVTPSKDVEKLSTPNKSHDIYAKAAADTSSKANNVIEEGMAICKICGRKFLEERLGAHEKACSKIHTKKRKPFVARKEIEGQPVLKTKVKTTTQAKPKSNWRKTHEEFVANIRAARQAQKILDAGGSVADLPPPPPSDTSHLTPCPHCSRKFSESAAARHIPLCKEKALRAKVAAPRANTKAGQKIGSGSRISGTRGSR